MSGFFRIGSGISNSGASLISSDYISVGDRFSIGWGRTIYGDNSHSLDCKGRVVVKSLPKELTDD